MSNDISKYRSPYLNKDYRILRDRSLSQEYTVRKALEHLSPNSFFVNRDSPFIFTIDGYLDATDSPDLETVYFQYRSRNKYLTKIFDQLYQICLVQVHHYSVNVVIESVKFHQRILFFLYRYYSQMEIIDKNVSLYFNQLNLCDFKHPEIIAPVNSFQNTIQQLSSLGVNITFEKEDKLEYSIFLRRFRREIFNPKIIRDICQFLSIFNPVSVNNHFFKFTEISPHDFKKVINYKSGYRVLGIYLHVIELFQNRYISEEQFYNFIKQVHHAVVNGRSVSFNYINLQTNVQISEHFSF